MSVVQMTDAEKAAIMGMDIDGLPDLPGFVTPPNGTYLATLDKGELKKLGTHNAVCINIKIRAVMELADPNVSAADTPKEGDIASLAFMTDNEYGLGNLKKLTEALKVSHGAKSLGDVLALSNRGDVIIAATLKRTENEKDGETRYYTNLVSVTIQ